MLDTRRVDHKCIDWERLMDSIEHRVVDSDEMSRMVNPAMKWRQGMNGNVFAVIITSLIMA